jgi:hypothetical protein
MNSFNTNFHGFVLADTQLAARRSSRRPGRACIVTALLLAGSGFSGAPLMAIEQPRYEILEKDGDIELRRYESYIVAETVVDADFERAGNEGFRRLADYIFGNNRSRQELAMTAPVAQSATEKIAMTAPVNMHREGNSYRITFMMPSSYTLETLPEPINPQVRLREVPGEIVASLRYSGRWNLQRYEDHLHELESWIETRGWRPRGEPILARYDPPFKPWFLRRNEVLITLEEDVTR